MDPITIAEMVVLFAITVFDTWLAILSKKEKNRMQKDIDFWRREAIKANTEIEEIKYTAKED